MRLDGDLMRYDHTVYLIKNSLPGEDSNSLDFTPKSTVTKAKANVKRTNVNFASGQMYDVTIIRVFGRYDADKIGLDDYNPDDETTIHNIQKIGRHFNRTDFYVANGEVTFNAQ